MSSQVDDRPTTNGHVPADPELRTYRGRTLEELLPKIRAELGPDAVIVRQRDGLMGGIGGFFQQQFVEVQARRGTRRIDVYDEAPAPPFPSAERPAREERPAVPAERGAPPARRPTPAELLAAATGEPGETRTPAEILREHHDTFAQQLAAAEARAGSGAEVSRAADAEPVAQVAGGARAGVGQDAVAGGAPAASVRSAAVDADPAPAANADADPAPAANADADPALGPGAGAGEARPSAARSRRRAGRARGGQARASARRNGARRAPSGAGTASAEAGAGRPSADADGAPARSARPATPAGAVASDVAPDAPTGGVGPQTTHALELAATIAARVADGAVEEPADADAPAPEPPAGAEPAVSGPSPSDRAEGARGATPAVVPARRSLLSRRGWKRPEPGAIVTSEAASAVTGTLAARGLTAETAGELLADAAGNVLPFTAGADVDAAVRTALARRIPVAPPAAPGGRAVAFVGAGGAGKTRCVAGLVAAYVRGSSIPVACLTLAPIDGGAALAALLKPHGVKVEAVASGKAAAKRLAALRREALVVIDTPTAALADPAAVEALAAELGALELDEVHLAVPATLSAAAAEELVERLGPLRPTAIAMTHADATGHVGAVVELACATRLPLSYVNSGLELPGALAPADPARLAERLLP